MGAQDNQKDVSAEEKNPDEEAGPAKIVRQEDLKTVMPGEDIESSGKPTVGEPSLSPKLRAIHDQTLGVLGITGNDVSDSDFHRALGEAYEAGKRSIRSPADAKNKPEEGPKIPTPGRIPANLDPVQDAPPPPSPMRVSPVSVPEPEKPHASKSVESLRRFSQRATKIPQGAPKVPSSGTSLRSPVKEGTHKVSPELPILLDEIRQLEVKLASLQQQLMAAQDEGLDTSELEKQIQDESAELDAKNREFDRQANSPLSLRPSPPDAATGS